MKLHGICHHEIDNNKKYGLLESWHRCHRCPRGSHVERNRCHGCILKREIKETILKSNLKDDYKNSGIKILNDIIYIVKKRLEIYTTHSFKYYLNQMVK